MRNTAYHPSFIVRSILALMTACLLSAATFTVAASRAPKSSRCPGNSPSQDRRSRILAAMRRRVMEARPLALFYTIDDSRGLDSLSRHADEMTVLAPQWFWVSPEGQLGGFILPAAQRLAHRAGLPVMPLVYNRNFLRETLTALLHNRRAQDRLIKELVHTARHDHLVGFQLDFENIDPADGFLYDRFVRNAACELHRDGRLLSVAVVPRFQDSAAGEWAAAYHYHALADSTDFLTLMTYDHSSKNGPPGPIAGYEWVKAAVEYAVEHAPANKLLMGVPLYGREWVEGGGRSAAQTLAYPETHALLSKFSLDPRWDERWRSPWFEFRTAGETRSVWYEDSRSLGEKLRLAEAFRLRGFAAWRLGMEDPMVWSLVSALRQGHAVVASRSRKASF